MQLGIGGVDLLRTLNGLEHQQQLILARVDFKRQQMRTNAVLGELLQRPKELERLGQWVFGTRQLIGHQFVQQWCFRIAFAIRRTRLVLFLANGRLGCLGSVLLGLLLGLALLIAQLF